MNVIEKYEPYKIKNMNIKISVIIAVYNIESYLERCVESVREQTYVNLEIILVDDGSTDDSGKISDTLASQDERIKVIHKKNGGLSDARNAGTRIATGEYIAYVDGDDRIDTSMYEDMMGAILETGADIAICRYRCIYPKHIEDHSSSKLVVFEGREALQKLIEEDENYCIQNAAWNKLYRREYTNELHFPMGKWYEDIVYTTKLLSCVERAVYLDKAYYNYVQQREGSIMAVGVNKRFLTDQIPAYMEKTQFLKKIGENELANVHDYFVYKRMLLMYTAFVRSKTHSQKELAEKKANLKQLREIIISQKHRFPTVYQCAVINPNEKKKMDIFLRSAMLYNISMYVNDNYIIPIKLRKILKSRVSKLHVVQMTGGLGNQMFQYALYCQLQAQGKLVKLEDELGYASEETREKHLKKAFHLTYERPTKEEMILLTDSSMRLLRRMQRKIFGRKTKSFVEKQFNFDPQVLNQDSAFYEGCWQSEKYFRDVEDRLRSDFIFRCEIPPESQKFLKKITEVNAVSLHIRRGDYLNQVQNQLYGGICTDQYYKKAIAYIREKVENPRFFIFTNDPDWAKANMTDDEYEVVDCNDESKGYLDMFLMSKCCHHIIANSSFSWWGAWLNPNPEKIIVAPSEWIKGRDCSDIYTKQMKVI